MITGSETPPWILRQQALLQQEQNEALLNQENVYNHTNEGQTRGSSLSTEANSDGHVMDANHDQQNHSGDLLQIYHFSRNNNNLIENFFVFFVFIEINLKQICLTTIYENYLTLNKSFYL